MKEITGDIWEYADKPENNVSTVLVTTNGFVTAKGENIMGAGIALFASKRYPFIKKRLGSFLRGKGEKGNVPYILEYASTYIVMSFPTKRCVCHKKEDLLERYRDTKQIGPYPGFMCFSNLALISRSAYLVRKYVDSFEETCVLLPKVGCANGGLEWGEVKPVLEQFFDERFIVVDLK